MYVYIESTAAGCFTTGFYDPTGEWHPDADWKTRGEAAERVMLLNGTMARSPYFGGGNRGLRPSDENVR